MKVRRLGNEIHWLELDSNKPIKEPSRLVRIARGSGRSIREVNELMEQHKQFARMVEKMKNLGKGRGGGRGDIAKMANIVPPHIMKQMGGKSRGLICF